MINIHVPSFQEFALSHLVVEFNGVLAHDGELCVGVRAQLAELAKVLTYLRS